MVLPALVLVLSGILLPAEAAQLFRYENDDGVVVLSSTLPPRYASRGYTILDHRGRVIREVSRQLTEAELQARRKQEAAEEKAQQAREERSRRDRELVRLYSAPEDVTRAMDRRIESIEGAMATMETGIARQRERRGELQERAADLERAGRPVPGGLMEELDAIDENIADREEEMAGRRQEIEEIRDSFARDRARLRFLLRLSDSPEVRPEDRQSAADETGAP
jgi:chromosome segregation ATPase